MAGTSPALIVVGNEKGGSGKSTVAMHLVAGLMAAGIRTGAIDLDHRQMSLSNFLANRAAWSERQGRDFPLPRLLSLQPSPEEMRAIAGSDSGFWLPTPIARDWKDTPGMAKRAGKRKREDTFPRSIYAREKSLPRTGIINPKLSLWIMGFPENWLENS